MNNNYQNNILDAIQTLIDNAVSKAGYDKTIKAIISKCTNEAKGEYVVRYQDSSFYAYSNDLDAVYRTGTSVYILVPGNDMRQTKTILGSVDKLGAEYISLTDTSAAYQEVGTSIIIPTDAQFGISSYKQGGDALVLYDSESSENLINIDLDGANLYFQQSKYIKIGGTFTTRLKEEQKRKGNFGLIFNIVFQNGTRLVGYDEQENPIYEPILVNKNYMIDINSMTGNPYSYNYGSEQYAIFEIDGANFVKINSIILMGINFPKYSNPYTNDIFVKDVEIKALNALTRDEIASNSLTFITKQGIYFKRLDDDNTTRLIETEVKIDRKVIASSSDLLRYYWFKRDSEVRFNDPDYLPYGGPGWRCINEFNVVDEETNVREYIVNQDTLTVAKDKQETEEERFHPE